ETIGAFSWRWRSCERMLRCSDMLVSFRPVADLTGRQARPRRKGRTICSSCRGARRRECGRMRGVAIDESLRRAHATARLQLAMESHVGVPDSQVCSSVLRVLLRPRRRLLRWEDRAEASVAIVCGKSAIRVSVCEAVRAYVRRP